jgi:hypothetical protein
LKSIQLREGRMIGVKTEFRSRKDSGHITLTLGSLIAVPTVMSYIFGVRASCSLGRIASKMGRIASKMGRIASKMLALLEISVPHESRNRYSKGKPEVTRLIINPIVKHLLDLLSTVARPGGPFDGAQDRLCPYSPTLEGAGFYTVELLGCNPVTPGFPCSRVVSGSV